MKDQQLLIVYGSVKAAESVIASTSQRLISDDTGFARRLDDLEEQLRLLARDIAKKVDL